MKKKMDKINDKNKSLDKDNLGFVVNDGSKTKYIDMTVKSLFQRTPSEEALQYKLDNVASIMCGVARIGDGSCILRLKHDVGDRYVVQQLMLDDGDVRYDDFPMLKGQSFKIEEIGYIMDGIMLGHVYAMCNTDPEPLKDICLS